jgi:hypothetical protein
MPLLLCSHTTDSSIASRISWYIWSFLKLFILNWFSFLTFNSLIITLISNLMPVGDFILTEGWTSTMWRLIKRSHVCMYSIHYSIFDSVWSSYQFPCSSHCPMHNLVPVLFPSRATGTFYFALQIPLFRCHCPSYIPHSQGAVVAAWSYIQHWSTRRSIRDWMSCLCPQWLRMKW